MKDRQTRLECLKIAATIKCQMKDDKIATVDLAKQFYAFVNADTADDGANGQSTDVMPGIAHQKGGYR